MRPLKRDGLSIMAQRSKNKCFQELRQKLQVFFRTHTQKSQVCQRIYSRASNWHSNCEDSDATNCHKGLGRREFAGYERV